MPRIKLVGLVNGESSPLDGHFLIEYDPSRPGITPDGREMTAHILTTPDLAKATVYTASQALELWKLSHGTRPDGKPNRPLTAYTVEIS